MSPVVFIDTNIPIYASGREHLYKEPCARIMRIVSESPTAFVTNVEVLQELVHHYQASRRWELGRQVVRSFAEIMHDRIEPIYQDDILLAARLADDHPLVSTRDLVHAAVMKRLGADHVISADTDFDRLPGITRLDPSDVEEWGNALVLGESV